VPNADVPETGPRPRRRLALAIRIVGGLIAILAIALCARTLVHEWSTVRTAVTHVRVGLVIVAFVVAAGAMAGLGVLWWRCLSVFGAPIRLREALAWYFAGELGKYLPGGIWQVVGRGELAQRSGKVTRPIAYSTTLISYAAMCIGAAFVCGVLAPFVALDGGDLGWGWAMIALIPLGVIVLHPAVFGRILGLVRRGTRGKVVLETPSWGKMIGLTACAVPTWALVGLSSVLVTEALGFHQNPARVAFAAIAAWIIGFLAVPVPAGAGVRELVFVALAGLAGVHNAPAIAVAAGARLLLIAVDGLGGIAGLIYAQKKKGDNGSARKLPRHSASAGTEQIARV
jgi:uncharacterized membrane protein YbhN (UPF0104 family)